jgi:hypothetical protein
MPKPTDTKPKPGDIVLLRGTSPRAVWAISNSPTDLKTMNRVGVVMPGALGLIISSAAHKDQYRFYTYVLWSTPCILGWIEDGLVRAV